MLQGKSQLANIVSETSSGISGHQRPRLLDAITVQPSNQLDLTENRAWIGTWSDRILETVRILRVGRGGLNWMVFICMLSCFDCLRDASLRHDLATVHVASRADGLENS
jgi:hypothetical protein